MAFSKVPTKVPTQIGTVVVILKDGVENGVPFQSANFQLDVKMSDGSKVGVTGDLLPHLTAGQLASLSAFMTAMHAKAVAEVLP